jgi:uncharacterized cupin superfamily protein
MTQQYDGGVVFTAPEVTASEYLPNKGVWLAGMLGKTQGDAFGLYHGRIEPGCGIAREIHSETSETVYVLKGEAVGLIGDTEMPLKAGQVMHVAKNVHHGIRNAGTDTLEILVIGHPDF